MSENRVYILSITGDTGVAYGQRRERKRESAS